jgi:hypothetical protein
MTSDGNSVLKAPVLLQVEENWSDAPGANAVCQDRREHREFGRNSYPYQSGMRPWPNRWQERHGATNRLRPILRGRLLFSGVGLARMRV